MASRDIIMAGILLFFFGLGFFVIHYVVGSVVDQMVGIGEINQSNTTVSVLDGVKSFTNRLDYIVLAVFIGMILGIIITGWFIAGNAIFTLIYFIVVVIVVVASTIFANVWETISQASVFGATIANFPILNHLLSYFPIYISVIGVAGLIVMFAKPYIVQE